MPLRIYLIGRSHLNLDELNRFLLDHNVTWKPSNGATHGEELAEISGRVCYMSFGRRQQDSNVNFIRHLISKGHESVLEHVNWTFLVTGISRAFTHQLVRHRVGFSFSQLSQQYYDQTEAEFLRPPILANFPKASAAWEQAVEVARKSYETILRELSELENPVKNGIGKKEIRRLIRSSARSVLPNATETKIVITANARAIRHFLAVRGSIPGDEEMRIVCGELLRLLKIEAPALFIDFEIKPLADGSPIVIQKKIED
jgi:thymidylate synthase (FAD)